MATAGFHLFASLTDVQGSRTPQLNTSCTWVREHICCQAAGIACPVRLLVGAICLREAPRHPEHFPKAFPSVQMHMHWSPAEIPPWSLAPPGSGAEKHIYPGLKRIIYPCLPDMHLLSSRAKLQALCSLGVTPPHMQHSLIIRSMQWIGSGIKCSWKMTRRQINPQHAEFKQDSLLTLFTVWTEGTAQATSSWRAKQLNV